MTSQSELGDLQINREYENFHELTKFSRIHAARDGERIVDYLVSPENVLETARNYKAYRNSQIVPITEYSCADKALGLCLEGRSSCRSFRGSPMRLDQLGALLVTALGANRSSIPVEMPGETMMLKPYPSGGGLYPIETYIIGIAASPVIAYFNGRQPSLAILQSTADQSVIHQALMLDDPGVRSASYAVVFTSITERSATKYGNRGYRFSLLEAGHMAQNICLAAAAEDLATVPWGSFYDSEIASLINVDGINECPVHALLIGGRHSD